MDYPAKRGAPHPDLSGKLGGVLLAAGVKAEDFPAERQAETGNGHDKAAADPVEVLAEVAVSAMAAVDVSLEPEPQKPRKTKAAKLAAGSISERARVALARTLAPSSVLDEVALLDELVSLREGQRREYEEAGATKSELREFDATPAMREVEEARARIAELTKTPEVLIAAKKSANLRAAKEKVAGILAKRPLTPGIIGSALDCALRERLVAHGMSGVAPFDWGGKSHGPAQSEKVCVDTALALGSAIEALHAKEDDVLLHLKQDGLIVSGDEMNEVVRSEKDETGTLHELVEGHKTKCIIYLRREGVSCRLLLLWKQGDQGQVVACTSPREAKYLFAYRDKKGVMKYGPLPFTQTGEKACRFRCYRQEVAEALMATWEKEEREIAKAKRRGGDAKVAPASPAEAPEKKRMQFPEGSMAAKFYEAAPGLYDFHITWWKPKGAPEAVVLDFQVEVADGKSRVVNPSETVRTHASFLVSQSFTGWESRDFRFGHRAFFLLVCKNEASGWLDVSEASKPETDSNNE